MKQTLQKIVNALQSVPDNFKSLISLNKQLLKAQQQKTELDLDRYLQDYLYNNPRYADRKKLNRHEFKVFSQGGEDGIISEIFRRVGATGEYFVEFGVGAGLENNSAYLLTKGWRGHWIEGSENYCKRIEKSFAESIATGRLTLDNAFINAENIEDLFRAAGVPEELDLLSIDIDGNDYWVWQAITNYRPRVVVVEYNAIYPPESSWVMAYNPAHQWDYTSYMGSSLKALEKLGRTKGYALVGCSFSGANAFFVRDDLLADNFCQPYTAENHYEPPRYFLCSKLNGHPRGFGKFKTV